MSTICENGGDVVAASAPAPSATQPVSVHSTPMHTPASQGYAQPTPSASQGVAVGATVDPAQLYEYQQQLAAQQQYAAAAAAHHQQQASAVQGTYQTPGYSQGYSESPQQQPAIGVTGTQSQVSRPGSRRGSTHEGYPPSGIASIGGQVGTPVVAASLGSQTGTPVGAYQAGIPPLHSYVTPQVGAKRCHPSSQ